MFWQGVAAGMAGLFVIEVIGAGLLTWLLTRNDPPAPDSGSGEQR